MTIATTAFEHLAALMARSHGYPDLPTVILPHPFETLPHAEVDRIAEESFPRVMAALLRRTAEQPAAAGGRR